MAEEAVGARLLGDHDASEPDGTFIGMRYSTQSVSPRAGVRVGFYDTLEDAQRSAFTGSNDDPVVAAIYESESTEYGDGAIVSVFSREHGWIDVVSVPTWWDRVPPRVRQWLVDHPGADLPSDIWIPVVRAGGTAHSVSWSSSDPSGMTLGIPGAEWVAFRAALDDLHGETL